MARRAAVISGMVALAVIVLAIIAWWLVAGSRTPPEPAASTPTPSLSPAPEISPTAAGSPVPAEVAEAIDHLPTEPSQYVSTQSPVDADFSTAFPEGTTTRAVENTWSSPSETQGMVQVNISKPGTPTETYAAMMVVEDGAWKVLATLPVTK